MFRKKNSFLLAGLLFASLNVAESAEWIAHLNSTPAAVSGTLAPLTLAIDGRGILEEKTASLNIKVNGDPVQVNSGENRPFYLTTQSDDLLISVQHKDQFINLAPIHLPKLKSVQVDSNTNELILASETPCHWRIDDENIPSEGAEIHWMPPSELWFQSPHTLELSSHSQSTVRSYNLRFEDGTLQNRHQRIMLTTGLSNHGNTDVLLGYARRWDAGWQAGVALNYISDPTLNTSGLLFELDRILSDRIDFGIFARVLFLGGSSVSVTNGDSADTGNVTTNPPPSVLAGPAVNFEVLNLGRTGFTVRLEEAIRVSGDSPSSSSIWGGVILKLE